MTIAENGMVDVSTRISSTDQLRKVSPDVADGFGALRRAIEEAGPLERKYRELINVAAFTTARYESSVRTHSGRALDAGATPEELRQTVLLSLAATTGMSPVADAIRWVDEVIASRS